MERLLFTNIPIVLTFAIAAWRPKSMRALSRNSIKNASGVPHQNLTANSVPGDRLQHPPSLPRSRDLE
ncbi:MAG: hypothetical protein HIU91_00610 [Acidobacteria bacterium]|nr:hypothetical protein [Acidobacteriota bacterium]